MLTLHPRITIGEMVKDRPARSRIFEQLKIDYCCGGKVPLAEACAKMGLDPEQVLDRIREADAADTRYTDADADADAMSFTELADHIEQTHHAYLREELPRLDFMTHKVATVHGDGEPRLHELRETFVVFRDELEQHMFKEERVLFPMVRHLDQADGPVEFHCGSLANPIKMMEHEHDSAGDALEKFRKLTDDFTAPDWACNTFRALYAALAELEPDMHQHVHKENNVLFPKALAREAQLNHAKAGA